MSRSSHLTLNSVARDCNRYELEISRQAVSSLSRVHVYRHNSAQLNCTISKQMLEISFIHVRKTLLNSTQLNWSF
jgi:hypothetical protein